MQATVFKKRRTIISTLAAIFVVCLSACIVFSMPENNVSAVGEMVFSAGEDLTYHAENSDAYVGVAFEYKINSGTDTVINICVIDGSWQNYYGYFEFGASGVTENYSGVSVENAEDGFIRVVIDFDAVKKTSGTRPKTTEIFYARGIYTTASGVIRNIVFLKPHIEEEAFEERERPDGKKYFAGRNAAIYAPQSKLYEKVIFEYKVSKIGDEDSFGVCLLDDLNTDYFGYYYFGSEGIKQGYNNSGVYVSKLDDGYFKVVMFVSELNRTNQSNNRKHAPSRINSIFLRDLWMHDSVYIRNVSFAEECTFSMAEGASVRLERPYGIKFKAMIPKTDYNENDFYGMAIIPADYLEKYSLTDNYVEKLTQKGVVFKNAYLKAKRDENLDYYVESYLNGLNEEDLTTKYVGIAYKIKDGVYTYADNIKGCVRAIEEVSEKAVRDVGSFRDYSLSGQDILREVVGCDKDAAGAFAVNAFDSNENFRKDDIIPASDRLSLSAAKGESESGEIVLTATSAVIGKTYSITPYDLVHEDGTTILSKDNFSFYNGNYTFVDSNYRHVVYPKDGQATDLGTGYGLVNALVPFAAAMNANETVFDCTYGDNRTILVDVYVPYAQKAGKYFGEFKIDVFGVGYKSVDVEFTVYDFTLPAENNANTIFAIPTNLLQSVYGEYSGYDGELYKELYDFLLDFNVNAGRLPEVIGYGEAGLTNYLNMLVEYSSDPRVSTINLFCGYSLVTYTYTYEKPKYIFGTIQIGTETVTETFDDVIVLDEYDRKGSFVNAEGKTVVYDDYGLRTILKKIAEYSIANDVDLFKKLVVNCPQIDEPSDAKSYASAILSYNAVRRSIDYVLNDAGIDWTGHKDIKAALDDIPFLVTVGPEDEVIAGNGIIDDVISRSAYIPADANNERVDLIIDYKMLKDFVALVASFDASDKPDEASRLNVYLNGRPEHTHVWWYTCCLSVNPYYNYGVNSDRVIMRANRWAQFGMGVDGELFCSVNNWISVSDDNEITLLTEDEVWEGKSDQAGLIEDCVLVYPNVVRYKNEDFRFVATYRLYAIRESIDDYNYLCYAQELIGRITDRGRQADAQAALNGILSSLYTNVRNVISDADILRHARAELVELILNLK